MSSIQTIVNNTSNWVRFRNAEHSEHNRWIGPVSSVSFEWRPWVPWAESQSDFDWPHYMSFKSAPEVPAEQYLRWYMYERKGLLEVFSDGYRSGRSPAGFPRSEADQLVFFLGPDRDTFRISQESDDHYE